jgi:hypothetical protein
MQLRFHRFYDFWKIGSDNIDDDDDDDNNNNNNNNE